MASKKEKLTGALSRIRTCDPPLRRRMLYPTELPGHKDIVSEPKVVRSATNLPSPDLSPGQRHKTRTQSVSDQRPTCPHPTYHLDSDIKPEPKVCPIIVQPVLSRLLAMAGTLYQNPRCPISVQPVLSRFLARTWKKTRTHGYASCREKNQPSQLWCNINESGQFGLNSILSVRLCEIPDHYCWNQIFRPSKDCNCKRCRSIWAIFVI